MDSIDWNSSKTPETSRRISSTREMSPEILDSERRGERNRIFPRRKKSESTHTHPWGVKTRLTRDNAATLNKRESGT